VKVRVLSADPKVKRIALSMKSEKSANSETTAKPAPRPAEARPVPVEDKIALLAERWKRR
jgi:ribosomal protein S1